VSGRRIVRGVIKGYEDEVIFGEAYFVVDFNVSDNGERFLP